MTKIKNTKKGMAKKTLSISLVAAMLATSNVPVWATEFSDGSDVTFTSEAPAEVVEEVVTEAPVVEAEEAPAAEVPVQTVVEAGDLKIDITLSAAEVEWGTNVAVSGSIVNKTTGAALDKWNYGWRVKGQTAALTTGEITNAAVANMSYIPADYTANTELELYIYRDDADASFGPVVIGTVKVYKKDISNAAIVLDPNTITVTNGTVDYNGRVHDETSVSGVTLGGTALVKDQDYTMTVTSAKNAGEELVVTVTAIGNRYAGSATTSVKIAKKKYATGDIKATVKDNVQYEYTGYSISLSNSDVTVKEADYDKENNTGLGGADLTFAVDSVTTTPANAYGVGLYTANVKLETGKLGNFSFNGAYETVTTGNKYEIVARDLKNVTLTVGDTTDGYEVVPTGTTVAGLINKMTFVGSDKKLLNISDDIEYTVKDNNGKVLASTATITDEGTYTVEVSPKAGNLNVKNSIPAHTFRAESNVIDKVTSTKFNDAKGITYVKDYTGAEIKPTKEEIGTITIKSGTTVKTLQDDEWEIIGYGNNIEASTYGSGTSTASYKRYAYVIIQVKQTGLFKDKKGRLNFEIAPLEVEDVNVTVPEKISYDKANKSANDYKVPVTVQAVDSKGRKITVPESAYSLNYDFVKVNNNAEGNVKGNKIQAYVVLNNHNYIGAYDNTGKIAAITYDDNGKTKTVAAKKTTEITAPVLNNASVVMIENSYVYTGGKITPKFKVMDGTLELQEGVDYKVKSITDAVDVGTGKVTVEGLGTYYTGEASATFTITPANVSDVVVTANAETYNGKKIKPTTFKATLKGNDVSDQFKLSAYGENTNAGKTAGSLTISVLSGNKNCCGQAFL